MKYVLQICLILGGISTFAQTKLMHQPAMGKDHIAFVYAEDLWVANLDGSNPRRLTIDEGIESNPVFSPDGTKIAFNAEYDGNIDVFVVPTTGGLPKRLTYHPYNDIVRDFSPDGSKVLFISQRGVHTNRLLKLYTIDIQGGNAAELPIPNAFHANFADDGKHIAYTPISEAFTMWKNYRGGRISRIWLYNSANHNIEEIPQIEGGNNDSDPQWMGSKVYFISDRDGEFNLYSYDVTNKTIQALTTYADFPVLNISANNETIVYEQKGQLHRFDLATGQAKLIPIKINTDLLEKRSRYVSGMNYLRSGDISPSGARTVVDFRGDIVTVPAKKGDPKNLTQTPGIHEKYPAWSPDGKSIAYFSDASGEYMLDVKNLQTEKVQRYALTGAGFYANIHWSPDSKKVCFVDNARALFLLDLQDKTPQKIAADETYFPGDIRDLFGSWSHDSQHVSYTKIKTTMFEQAFVYSLKDKRSRAVSDGLSNVTEPVFDPSGKYLYMLASTDAGPLVNWFDQSNHDMTMSVSIHLVTLQKEVHSPLRKESDEEIAQTDEPTIAPSNTKKNKSKGPEKETTENNLTIDWEGLDHRIINLPIRPGLYSNLQLAKEGELYYVAAVAGAPSTLKMYSFKDREEKTIMPLNAYVIAAGGKKMLYLKNGSWGITNVGAKPTDPPINMNAISVKIDPVKEWKNIFNEVWRVNRDYFYDPGMHGADWPAMKQKYEPFLAHVTCKNDLYRVMQWMCSELSVGHHRFDSRGDRMNNPERINGGLLGADYQVKNNRYQISKIYGGLNWSLDLRSPLTEPGVDVAEGDYIIEVNGKQVRGTDNLFSFFENTAGKIVNLKVAASADGKGAKTVKVTPVGSEMNLRNRAWIENNIKKVDEATNGQVAYVYVPNTTTAGHEHFKRYFFPQAQKKAIIVDERYNGGGSLADYYIDILKRPLNSQWKFRYGADLKAPSASIQGPKVLIVNETSSSGGDYFPYLFRQAKLGTIVGKRTWGGLVGVLGYPELIDGGIVTSPNVAFYDEQGYGIENVGVSPDISIEQLPELVVKGHDPQLEKAIEIALEGLKKNPPKSIKTPDFPIRVRK